MRLIFCLLILAVSIRAHAANDRTGYDHCMDAPDTEAWMCDAADEASEAEAFEASDLTEGYDYCDSLDLIEQPDELARACAIVLYGPER